MFGITSSRSTQIKAAMQQILKRRKAKSAGNYAPTSLKLDFYDSVNGGNYKEALRLGQKILGALVWQFLLFFLIFSLLMILFFGLYVFALLSVADGPSVVVFCVCCFFFALVLKYVFIFTHQSSSLCFCHTRTRAAKSDCPISTCAVP